MTPSWYDVLDVAPDATTDQIRAAWRTAVADLDPTDRRFAVLNRAAKVLLDPEARAAHDAELATQEDEDVDEAEEAGEVDVPDVVVPRTTTTDEEPAEEQPPGEAAAKPVLAKATDATPEQDAEDVEQDVEEEPEAAGEARRPVWVALVAGVVALLLAALSVWAVTGSTSDEQLDEDVTDAQAAAERAIVPVLSYDATDLQAGRSTALSYLTEDFGQDYAELFDGLIEGNAEEIGAQVQATLLASAVVRTDPEVTRVQVLVFVDQQTTNDQLATPRTDSNQVTVTMERVGDEWLVDDLDTGAAG